MADALLSALVSTILGNLNSLTLVELGVAGGLKAELENLESTLTTIQAVLQDAEEKQWKSEAVKNWLRKLKDVAYDADDLLDEFAIEAQRRVQQRGLKNQVRSFVSLDQNPLVFRFKMAHKLKSVTEKLDAIANEKNKFHLKEASGNRDAESFQWRLTSSLVNESEIYGRDKEKEVLINILLSNSDGLLVYAICGMGGIGKTALAQLVFNDGSVERHFDLRIWVCVSDDFDIRRLTRAIIESLEGRPCTFQELDPLQRRLQEKLSGRKFLLILDDVWDHYHDEWNLLKNALRCGGKESVVIITTRIKAAALKMATVPFHSMRGLSDDDSWSLFEQRAFGSERRDEYVHLEAIGKEIVKKCGRIPLAIKAMGSLMRLKRKESEWLSIMESEIWDLPDEGSTILPALRISYDHLPPHLRQCFAFCSIFPKDYLMRRDRLIELWMANGFISFNRRRDLHDMGHDVFGELVWRSFFQDVEEDRWGIVTCKMHDLVHDLAQSIMMRELYLNERDKEFEVPRNVRHVAVYRRSIPLPPMKDHIKFKSMRSLILLNSSSWNNDLLPYFLRQKNLRALCIHGYNATKLPESIGSLKHLRCLNVSFSSIEVLPESFSFLQNLQTLTLTFCHRLHTLPKGMKHLKNLRYLNTEGSALRCMPVGIGQLTCLRKLSMFVVGEGEGHRIGELKRLNNLEDHLSIVGLENVKILADARSANLIQKNTLQSLGLCWGEIELLNGGISGNLEKSEEILSGLQPHPNLKILRISRYGGSKCPNWMMDLLLPNLVDIQLYDCRRCQHLPPFGKLQFLKYLSLRNLDAVECIGSDVYGDGENPFPSLESLTFQSMLSLKEWATEDGDHSFSCLRELTVVHCPELDELPIIPSLKKLRIETGSNTVLRSIMNFTALSSLTICSFHNMMTLPDGLLQNHTLLERLEIFYVSSLKSLSNQLDNLSALKHLRIQFCFQLEILPEDIQNLSSLESLHIERCSRLSSLPITGLCGLFSLRTLEINSCSRFVSLSNGVQHLTALEDLKLEGCPELNSLPESIQHLTSLRSLRISGCQGFSCLPSQIEYLTSLSRLEIEFCPNLMSLPEGIRSLNLLRELKIKGCPNVERRCKNETGEDWTKISHIPTIIINDQQIESCNG